MAEFAILRHEEPVGFDQTRLEELYLQLGAKSAESVVCRTMEDIAVRLSDLAPLHRSCQLAELSKRCHSLIGIAEQIGLDSLAHAAAEVSHCTTLNDPTALAATLCRLERVGERSLTAVWNMQDATL